jgi:hypothetical protein
MKAYIQPLRIGTGQSAETVMLVSSLREVISTQAQEIEALRTQLQGLTGSKDAEVCLIFSAKCAFNGTPSHSLRRLKLKYRR